MHGDEWAQFLRLTAMSIAYSNRLLNDAFSLVYD